MSNSAIIDPLRILGLYDKPKRWQDTPASVAVHLGNGYWKPYNYLTYLSDKLTQMEDHPIFLIITIPPRHGKSELISHWLPVWFLNKWPSKRVILTSYEAGYAADWGGTVKDTIDSNQDELGIFLTRDTKSKSNWKIQGYGGGMITAGVGGPITGRGAHLAIIDDPIKNYKEALSPTYRENNWQWYRSTLRTRLEPGASIIIIMTRWHEDDLAGRLIADPGEDGIKDEWEVINIPAIAKEDDILGRKPGEALNPERYDIPALNKLRISTGPYWWPALYEGSPVAEGGNIIKMGWFKYYDALPHLLRIIQIWDTAFEEDQRNDRSACITLGEGEHGYYLIDCYAARLEFPDLQKMLKAKYFERKPSRILVEYKVSGISLVQQIRRDTKLPILPVKPEGSKEMRAHSVTGIIEAGKVFLPEEAPWLSEFLNEVTRFPAAPHDDIVDAFVYGLEYLKPTSDELHGRSKAYDTGHKESAWRE